MPNLPDSYFTTHKEFADYFHKTHTEGALAPKTKALMHLALVLAYHCEP